MMLLTLQKRDYNAWNSHKCFTFQKFYLKKSYFLILEASSRNESYENARLLVQMIFKRLEPWSSLANSSTRQAWVRILKVKSFQSKIFLVKFFMLSIILQTFLNVFK
jgi:hypothetical protein